MKLFHTWEKWECYPAGFYNDKPPKGIEPEECEEIYREFLSNTDDFGATLEKVITEWKHSCEHYLSNPNMNRIAWLGQAALAHRYGIPSRFRGGYNLLSPEQQKAADDKALEYLNKWMVSRGEPELTSDDVQSRTQANLY